MHSTPVASNQTFRKQIAWPDLALNRALGWDTAAGWSLSPPDNCEHLLNELAPLVVSITRRCPGVRLLATSRRRLGLASELVLPLETLAVPDPEDPVETQQLAAAARLFVDRVRRLRPAFGLTADNIGPVADLCRRLDGLPLALELTASRAATLGAAAVLDRLPAALVGQEAADPHDVVAWSHRLLDDPQRQLMACLSVFASAVRAVEI